MYWSWKCLRLSVLGVMGVFFAGALAAQDVVDMFMEIPDIPGESTTSGYEGKIDIESINWGLNKEIDTSGDGRATGRAVFKDLTVRKYYDASSPLLALACARGDAIARLTLTSRRQAGGETQPYLVIELKNVLVTSYQTSASRGDSAQEPVETVAMNFEEIKITYKQRNGAGDLTENIEFNWNVVTGTGG